MRKTAPIATYVGLALAVVGFLLIALAWNGAAEQDCVQCQFPYMISGGITGIGLIIVGVTVLVLDMLRRDGDARSEQLSRVTDALTQVNAALSPADAYDPIALGEYRPRPRTVANGAGASTGSVREAGWQKPQA